MSENANTVKEKLRSDQLTVGSWINLAHPGIVEIMADAGFEWLVVDLEHSAITLKEAEELIRIISLKGITPLVRLTSNDPNQGKRVMDAGSLGVIVPMVNNRDEAESAVRIAKYPPAGERGFGLARAHEYGPGFESYINNNNEESIIIIQIEHIDAINNLEEILTVDGIDATFIGPYDLSGSLGKPGRYEDSDVVEALLEYENISKKCNVPMGFHVIKPDISIVVDRANKGYRFVAFSTDFMILGESCRSAIEKLGNSL